MANLLGLAMPIVMIQVYDRIIPNEAFETLTALAIGLTLAIVADNAIRIARGQILALAGARFEVQAYDRAFEKLLSVVSTSDKDESPGTLYNRLMSIERVRAFHTSAAAAALLDIPFIVIFIALMALIAPALGATILALVLIVFVTVQTLRRKVLHLNIERQEMDGRRHSFLVETLAGIEMIKSLGVEDFMERRYERLMSGAAPLSAELSRRVQFIQGVTGAIGMLAPVLTAGVGSLLVINDQMTVGGMAAAVLLTGRIIQPALRIEALITGEQDLKRSEREYVELMEASETEASIDTLMKVDQIELSDVVWKVEGSDAPIIDKVSLKLERGDCLAILGGEGSGRTVLLSLIAGFLKPELGTVHVNGEPIDRYSLESRARRISLLTRNHSLLEGTLLENITAFQEDLYLEEALALTAELGIDEFISRHPSGLSMKVSGTNSSGLPVSVHDGVLLIAGLVSRPDVILFDEANAGLDHKADQQMIRILKTRRKDCITLLVTHRPSYLALATQVLELVNGKLIPHQSQSSINQVELPA